MYEKQKKANLPKCKFAFFINRFLYKKTIKNKKVRSLFILMPLLLNSSDSEILRLYNRWKNKSMCHLFRTDKRVV